MDAKKYVNAIARKIKCNGKKKKEIKKQLLLDIDMRICGYADMRLSGIYVR